MANLAAKQIDQPERREVSKSFGIVWIGGLGEDQPDAVVFWVLWAIPQHYQDSVACIDSEAREHGSDVWLKRSQSFKDERVGSRFAFIPRRLIGSVTTGHSGRITRHVFMLKRRHRFQIVLQHF